nr:hypothetical protein [Delftia acidovorans]
MSELESLATEVGLKKAMGTHFKAARSGKKPGFIAALLRCTVPGSHGAFFSLEQEKALWQSACMAAPAQRRVSARNSS